jgi:predicted ArsR family transcriptional regulator
VTGLIDSAADLAVSGRRAEVLAGLRQADGPLSVTDIAALTGLHINTARFHLDALVTDGLAERSAEPRNEPGRPRILYYATGPVPGPRSYRLLAEILTGLLTSLSDVEPAALDAGRSWGRHLVERAAPSDRVDADEAVTRLHRVLDAIGFQPEVRPRSRKSRVDGKDDRKKSGTDIEIWLHHCPFREVAERHTDVVCAMHLGLMQGALDELHAPVEAMSLEPFSTPKRCVARLRDATASGQRAPAPQRTGRKASPAETATSTRTARPTRRGR